MKKESNFLNLKNAARKKKRNKSFLKKKINIEQGKMDLLPSAESSFVELMILLGNFSVKKKRRDNYSTWLLDQKNSPKNGHSLYSQCIFYA